MENNASDVSSQSRGHGIEFARDRDGSTLGCNALPYAEALYNLAHYLSRNEADAKDLVQETHRPAIQAADRFTPGTNLWANALENNFRLYTMTDGQRRVIASATVTEPKLGEWHSIRVVAKGAKVQAYLDNALLLDHDDRTFTGGYVGLWTKADSRDRVRRPCDCRYCRKVTTPRQPGGADAPRNLRPGAGNGNTRPLNRGALAARTKQVPSSDDAPHYYDFM